MAPPPMLGKKRQASLLDANSRCMSKCKDLITKAVVPGIEYAHECKQLQRFAKSLLIPLEDLSDNVFTDAALEKKGMDSMCKVRRPVLCSVPFRKWHLNTRVPELGNGDA